MLPDSHLPFLVPEYGTFPKYMFDTGPRVIMDNWVELDETIEPNGSKTPKYTILIKREGSSNLWHCLLEIFSTSLTLNILQMGQTADSTFSTTPNTSNTQVVLLDDHTDGPFFDLWSIFTNQSIRRLKDLPPTSFENIILPLAGGSNPLWQTDYSRDGASCNTSTLLRTFSRRVLDHYGIPAQPRQGSDITVTFIDRMKTRVLLNHTEYLEDVKSSFPNVIIQEVDFETISFKEQLQVLRQTDILVGVHGAGLTHAMFLPPRSSVVEILPPQVDIKVFENLASLLDHSYFSVRSSKRSDTSPEVDWHQEPVSLDREKFVDVLDIALENLYNKSA
jgi:protein O-GlcNAc transferase